VGRISRPARLSPIAWAATRTCAPKRDDLIADGRSVDEAEYWLDVVVVQPCPEDHPTED